MDIKNISKFSVVACISLSFLFLTSAEPNSPKLQNLCKTAEACHDLNNPCKCYCGVKCGPRDKKNKMDKGIFDKKLGVCWCQKRDIKFYAKNACPLKK